MKNNNIKGKLVIITTLALLCLESSAWPWSRQTQPNNANNNGSNTLLDDETSSTGLGSVSDVSSQSSTSWGSNPRRESIRSNDASPLTYNAAYPQGDNYNGENSYPNVLLNNMTSPPSPSLSSRGSGVFSQGSAWTGSSIASSQSSIASNSNPNSLLNNTPPSSYPSSPNSSMGGSTASLPPYESPPPSYESQQSYVNQGVNNVRPSASQQSYGNQGVNSFHQPSAPQQPYGNQWVNNVRPSASQQPYGDQGVNNVRPAPQQSYVNRTSFSGSRRGSDVYSQSSIASNSDLNSLSNDTPPSSYPPSPSSSMGGSTGYDSGSRRDSVSLPQNYQQVDPLAQKYKYVLKINDKYFGSNNGVDKWFIYDANTIRPKHDVRLGLSLQNEKFVKIQMGKKAESDIRFFISGKEKYLSSDGENWYNVTTERMDDRKFPKILVEETSDLRPKDDSSQNPYQGGINQNQLRNQGERFPVSPRNIR